MSFNRKRALGIISIVLLIAIIVVLAYWPRRVPASLTIVPPAPLAFAPGDEWYEICPEGAECTPAPPAPTYTPAPTPTCLPTEDCPDPSPYPTSTNFPPQPTFGPPQPTPSGNGVLGGWWDHISRPEVLAEYAAHGSTVALPYGVPYVSDAVVLAYLDEAYNHGIQVIVDLHRHPDKYTFPAATAEIQARVNALKDHPAVYGWYVSDEPEFNNESPQYTQAIYDAIKGADTEHPAMIVHYHQLYPWTPYTDWKDSMDVLMVNWYPGYNCNQLPIDCSLEFDMMVRHSYRYWLDGVEWVEQHDKESFVAVPSGFGADKGAQDMTMAEYRFHALSALAVGADAVIFWQAADFPPNDTIKPRIEAMIGLIDEVSAEMAAGVTNDSLITVTGATQDQIVYRYYGVAGDRYVLLAVNIARWDAADDAGEALPGVTFTLPPGVAPAEVEVLDEGRTLLVGAGGTIKDDFNRFEVHIYVFNIGG